MPDRTDRSDYPRLAGMAEDGIDYSAIPRLNDVAWTGGRSALAYHVVPKSNGWVVRKSGASKSSSVFVRKAEAIRRARTSAKRERSVMVVHGRDGSIREYVSFLPVSSAAE